MNVSWHNIGLLIWKELLNARRNRWYLFYVLIFTGLVLSLSWMGLAGVGTYKLSGFGRTTASLVNLTLMIIPLMGLTLGAMSLAQERENGTLLYVLAQPVSPTELLLGKFFGLSIALLSALLIGFGISGYLIALKGGTSGFTDYLWLLAFAFLLALVSLALGILLSSLFRKAEAAIGISVFAWLVLIFFSDLGMLATTLKWQLSIEQIFTLALFNPLQVFRIGALLSIRHNLEVLGPVGLYAIRHYGHQLAWMLMALLAGWVTVLLGSTQILFQRRGVI
ncbi:MAG: ABC transporter permease [Calditrichaeota bacterium]|nr:MAG: ABC transporter permease [Calditrichota bacterium]